MSNGGKFLVLVVDLETGVGKRVWFGDRRQSLGGSGLAAALYDAYGVVDAPVDDPRQPLIFAIGPMTGYFPLMSKVVCGFRSPYHGHYAESHAGGRMALALRFSGYDALVLTGRARTLSCVVVGERLIEVRDVHFLKGYDNFATGKILRKMLPSSGGHRSIARIGPAGENLSRFASINVDTYRHFGRLGGGAVMGMKNVKAVVVHGDGNIDLPDNKDYAKVFKAVYDDMTGTDMMRKYHDLGTAENLWVLNKIRALPWNNLQKTSDEAIGEISGERFADQLLLRKTACSGCPVGCIHVGLLREKFGPESEYLYRQVSYDYEPIFAGGSMLGLKNSADVLTILDEVERQGLDIISAGVALAWATEALEKGVVSEAETMVPLRFGEVEPYKKAITYLGGAVNDFYRELAKGALAAADTYGGADYACVLGQEMAGYATGEVYYTSQAYGLRHSHLDAGGYSYDQKTTEKNAAGAVAYLLDDERKRVLLTCMVSCLFARQVYHEDRLAEAMASIGYGDIAGSLPSIAAEVQKLRWRVKFKTGWDPDTVRIPKRYLEVETWKGKADPGYLDQLGGAYKKAIREMATPPQPEPQVDNKS